MIQNLWDTAEAFLRRRFTVIQACLRKQEKNFRQPNLTPKGMSHCEKKKKRQTDLEEDHIKYLALKSIVIEIKYSMEELSS